MLTFPHVLFSECRDQSTAEIGDVFDDAPPHHIAFAKCWFIDPYTTGIGDIVFNTSRACRFAAMDNTGRDWYPAAVTDGRYDFALLMYIMYQLKYRLVTTQFIRSPAARNDDSIQLIGTRRVLNIHVGRHFQTMLAAHSFCGETNYDDLRTLFA